MLRPSLASLALCVLALASTASAQSPAVPAVPPDSWAGQLDALGRWAALHSAPTPCATDCFVIDHVQLSGAVPVLAFEVTGHVIATAGSGAVNVPLFGPPASLVLRDVREGNSPAIVGFTSTSYYLHTASRDFTVRGTLALRDTLAIEVPGPVNTLDAVITGGSIAEGEHLAGLSSATLHVTTVASANANDRAQPAVFQRSRALRIGREVKLEEHVSLRSGTDLGVVRLPLLDGTHVLDVTGASGWHVEGRDLVVPTTGHEAELVVNATLDGLAGFSADPRSSYEWWMLESDPEHQLAVETDGHAVDPSQSPIARTQPTARLYLVPRNGHLSATVRTLASADVLAAVVRSLDRTLIVTARGDLVAQDTLAYDDNGIDYLAYDPHVAPVYLATDGVAERILREPREGRVMIPLRNGAHAVMLQGVGHASLAPLVGRMDIPMATHALTTSSAQVHIGLPASLHVIALAGGDHPYFFLDVPDALAFLAAFVTALVLFRDRASRLLATVAFAGVWFVAPPLFVAALATLLVVGALWLAWRLVPKRWRGLAMALLACGGGVFVLIVGASVLMVSTSRSPASEMAYPTSSAAHEGGSGLREARAVGAAAPTQFDRNSNAPAGDAGNLVDNVAMLPGAIPVALTLPSSAHRVEGARELVTTSRPFAPVLFYATDLALAPFALAWLACLAQLVRLHRTQLARVRDALRARLAAPAP